MTAPTRTAPTSPNGKRPPFNADGIPETLKALPQWVLWRYQGRGKKQTKVPYQANDGKASSINPATWCTFPKALQAAPRFDGLGIVIANGLWGFDLDHKINAAGQLDARSQAYVDRLNTYTERSPGGDGLHILGFGELPGDSLKRDGFELYGSDRYFTVTGDRWPGTPAALEHRDGAIAEIYEELAAVPNPFSALVLPASALAGRDPAPANWQIQDVAECGELVLFNSPGGGMKSLFTQYLMVRISVGLHCLPHPDGTGGLATTQSAVFWLNSDNSQRTHEERLIALLRTLGTFDVPFYSLTTTDFELSRPDHVGWLADLVADCGAKVLVIDTLSGVLPGVEENSAQEMTTPAANLRALANAGLTVFVLHHPPKNDVNGSRGSSVLEGKVDRRFTLTRDGDLLTLKPAKTRGRGKPPIVAVAALESDPRTEALTGLAFFDGHAARTRAENEQAESAILEVLDAGALNTRKLYKAVKMPRARIDDALSSLLAIRQVKVTQGANRAKIYERA